MPADFWPFGKYEDYRFKFISNAIVKKFAEAADNHLPKMLYLIIFILMISAALISRVIEKEHYMSIIMLRRHSR